MTTPLVLKLGGELLESAAQRERIASLASAITADRPLVLVHGGGRSVDAELDRRGIAPKKVDGLRITDAPTRDVVVAVLGGTANTEFVATLVSRGVAAVGLTGIDAGLGRAARVNRHESIAGPTVDLGFVGDPADVDASLIELLTANGYVPVVASLGLEHAQDSHGSASILNVNADVMACRIAAALGGSDLVIAGATAGVLDANGQPIATLDVPAIDRLIADGTATAGMIAKLSACRAALNEGVASVRIVDGRTLDAAHGVGDVPGTLLVALGQMAQVG